MALSPYRGPVSLLASKHATYLPAHMRGGQAGPFAGSSSRSSASGSVTTSVSGQGKDTIATAMTYTPATALAVAQSERLADKVNQHVAHYTKDVSETVTKTRKLLELLNASIKKDGGELQVVDNLWQELEKLIKLAVDAASAVPEFLEQQTDHVTLYHNSRMNETMHDVQAELNTQNNKINLQHSLILDQQKAFQDYQKDTSNKLTDLVGLQERCSRLTLDKGLLKSELTKTKEELHKANESIDQGAQLADDMKKQRDLLSAAKQELFTETQTLRKTISDLQRRPVDVEHEITDKHQKEIHKLKEALGKETQKAVTLDALVETIKSDNQTVKNELDQLKELNKTQTVKYKNQSNEYSTLLAKVDGLNESKKELEQLKPAHRLLAVKYQSLLDEHKRLSKAHEDKMKDANAKVDAVQLKLRQQIEATTQANHKVNETQTNMDDLAAQLKKAPKGITGSEVEATIATLEQQVLHAQEREAEWRDVGVSAYTQFQEAEARGKALQEAVDAKEAQIAQLQRTQQNQTASFSTGNGGTAEPAQYWKQRYETLLARITN